MIQKLNKMLLGFVLLLGSMLAKAQNGQFDVRFTVKNFDCTNNKLTIQLQVKAHDASHTFKMGDANYRFDFDPRVIKNPAIVSQENFSNLAPSSDFNYLPQNLNGTSTGTTIGTVSLNTFYSGSGTGAKAVGTNWMTVACIRFDVLDASKCTDLLWHTDTQFPVTGMNEVVLPLVIDGNYDLAIVGAGGMFGNYNVCIPSVCNGILALDDINSTLKDKPLTGNLLTNDQSSGGAMMATTTPLLNTVNGVLTLSATGAYTYVPNAGFLGVDSAKYIVCNAAAQCDTATLRINVLDNPVAGINSAPIAHNDNATTLINTPVSGVVLINDFDTDGGTLTVSTTPISSPMNGTVVLNPNGTFIYTPNPDFIGQDTFRYKVCDNGTPSKCDTAMVVLNVLIDINGTANDRPNAQDDAFTTTKATPVSGSVKPNDTDPNSGQTLVFDDLSAPTNGSLVFNTDGTFTYTPNPTFMGPDLFTYTACDNGVPAKCDTSTVYLTVLAPANLPPVVPETPQTTPEDMPKTVCLAIADPNSIDTFTVSYCNTPALGSVTATVNNTTKEVCMTYTPSPNKNGQDTVCLIVCDNGIPSKCDTIRVPFTIVPVNDTPIVTETPKTTTEDLPVSICQTITDVDVADTHTATLCTLPAHGTASAPTVVAGQVCLTYTPNPNFNGLDTVCVIVCDNGMPSKCDTIKVPVTVSPINDAPVVTETPKTTTEDVPVSICQTITDVDVADTHRATLCTAPAHGTVSAPTVVAGQVCLTYTPNPNFNGADTVCVIVCDNGMPSKCDTIKVPVTVSPVNDAPVVTETPKTTTEDVPVSICQTITDVDVADTHTATLCTLPAHGAASAPTVVAGQVCLTYTPNPNFNGLDTVCVIVCDNGMPSKCDTIKVPITVSPVNDAPVVPDVALTTPNNKPVTTCLPISDVETADNHTFTICGAPLHGTLSPSVNNVTHQLCLTFTPTAGFIGTDSACVIVCDNGTPSKCDTVKIKLNIISSNIAPIATNDIYNGLENLVQLGHILVNDSDPNGDQITLTTLPIQAPAHGTIVIAPDGTYQYTPNTGFIGTDFIKYKICDNGFPSLCDTGVLQIEVRPKAPTGNQSPMANDDNTATPSGTPITVPVKANDADPNGDVLGTPTLVSAPVGGTFVVNPDGTITFTPTPGFIGAAEVLYAVCDNGTPLKCDTAKLIIEVYPNPNIPNLAPVAINDAKITNMGTPVTGTVVMNDSDPNLNQVIAFTQLTAPANGRIVFNNNGTYDYTPNMGFVGSDMVSYRVCDNGSPSLCDTAVVEITVQTVPTTNLAPIAKPDVTATTKDVPVVIPVKANDADPNGNPLTSPTIVGTPTNGTTTVNPDGTITFTPTPGVTGVGTFQYQVCDNAVPALCATTTATVEIKPTPAAGTFNLPPVAVDDAASTLKNTSFAGNVATNDTDPNVGQTKTFSLVSNSPNVSVTLNANGSYTYSPLNNFVGTDVFVYKICDNGSPVLCDTGRVYITIFENPCVNITLKVLLEGPYQTSTSAMTTILNQRGLLPGQTPTGVFAVATQIGQPYKGAPWNFAGQEGDTITTYPATVTDWVLVSLRTSTALSSTVFKAAAWLHKDGTVQFITPCFNIPISGSYYVVIEHRNHMGVMSPTALAVVNGTINFDFTAMNSYEVTNPPSFGQKQIGTKWAMYTADSKKETQTTNYDINFQDSQLWKGQSGIFDQYKLGDHNLDADVNFLDQVRWKANSGKYSGVPH
jgi:large repetitive protein